MKKRIGPAFESHSEARGKRCFEMGYPSSRRAIRNAFRSGAKFYSVFDSATIRCGFGLQPMRLLRNAPLGGSARFGFAFGETCPAMPRNAPQAFAGHMGETCPAAEHNATVFYSATIGDAFPLGGSEAREL